MSSANPTRRDDEAEAFLRAFLHAGRNAMQRGQSSLSLLRLEASGYPQLLELVAEVQEGSEMLATLFETASQHLRPLALAPASMDTAEVVRQSWRDSVPAETGARLVVTPESLVWTLDLRLMDVALRAVFQNALEACPEGLVVRVTLQAADGDGGSLVLCIEDNGPGVDDTQFQRMLEPFWSTRPGASGMGLPRARRIVEAHGGRLVPERSEGAGLRLRMTLPWSRPRVSE